MSKLGLELSSVGDAFLALFDEEWVGESGSVHFLAINFVIFFQVDELDIFLHDKVLKVHEAEAGA